MALKLDLSKTYDRVEWHFLCAMLSKMGFDRTWVNLIQQCLSSVRYHIVSGGLKLGPIVPSRGIRQGDPISPYLFLVCAEGLSALIRRFEERRWLHGCRVANRAPIISHLIFADDNYIYCKATDRESDEVQRLLRMFEVASEEISKDIERMMSKFWWRPKVNQDKGIHWMSWKRLGRGKDEGGMGFRNIRDFNLALLAKQGWRLLVNNQSLVGRIFQARYFPSGTYLTAVIGNNPSYIWRSILEAQFVVKMGVRKCIASGSTTSILRDPWLNDEQQPFIMSSNPTLVNQHVSTLMKTTCREWDDEVLLDVLCDLDYRIVRGMFTVRSAYNLIQENKGSRGQADNSGFWRSLWQLKVPPKRAAVIPDFPSVASNFAGWFDDGIKHSSIEEVVSTASLNFVSWSDAQNKYSTSPNDLGHERYVEYWTKPELPYIKVNVDGAIFSEESRFSFGMVARDSNDFVLEAVQTCCSGSWGPLMVEALGLKEALSWIKRKGWHHVIVETDCLTLINDIKNAKSLVSPYGLVLKDCISLLTSLISIECYFVKRSANRLAHAFARAYLLEVDRILSGVSLPACYSSLVLEDSF
uniref:Reverse transcriptase domain-containing protein n=1 Tax=Cannabis sativa TaxID=3483 RepID=A0A803NKG4_CANSA